MLTKLACALAVLPSVILSQNVERGHVVRAAATATISVRPDRAEISVGVITQAASADAASASNASQTTRVISALKAALGSRAEIKTSDFSITPQFRSDHGAQGKITSYQASNTVTVTVNDLNLIGKIIDTATAAGANNVQNTSFTLRDDQAVRSQALAEAAVKARASAEAIAKALNLRVTGVFSADAETTMRPMLRGMPIMTETAEVRGPTPIEIGNIDVTESVTVTLSVE